MKERPIPFVIGVLADLSGSPKTPLPKLKDRRFVAVTRESLPVLLRLLVDAPFDAPCASTFEEILGGFLNSGAAPPAASAHPEGDARRLAATWLGLKYLVDAVADYPGVRVKVLNVSKKESLRDLQRAPEFDQSALFKHIFSHEVDTFGGEPFGCILADYSFTRSPDDVNLLEGLSAIAASSGAPFLIGLGPDFFDLKDWADFNPAFRPGWLKVAPSNVKWWSFQRSNDSGPVFALMGRFRVGSTAVPEGSLWCNPVYRIASLAASAFRETGLPGIARRLFPSGEGTAVAPAETVFEWDCPQDLAAMLATLSLHALTPRFLTDRPLQKMTPLRVGDVVCGFGLAQALYHGAVHGRLKAFVRTHLTSGSVDECENLLHQALQELGLKDPGSSSPLQYDSMDYLPWGNRFTINFVSPPEFSATGQACRFGQSQRSYHLGHRDAKQYVPIRFRLHAIPRVVGELATKRSPYPTGVDTADLNTILQCEPYLHLEFPRGGADAESGKQSIGFGDFADFDPARLARQIRPLRLLLEDRSCLVEIAAHAGLSVSRSSALGVLAERPGALPGIAVRLEAWKSASSSLDSPVDPDEIERSIPGGISNWAACSHVVWWEAVFQVYERLNAASPREADAVERISGMVEKIDDEISSDVLGVYQDGTFQRLESTCLAIRRLAEGLPKEGADLRIWSVPWSSDDFKNTAHLIDPVGGDSSLQVVILDGGEGHDGDLEPLAALLESVAGWRAIVLYACTGPTGDEWWKLLEPLAASDFARNLLVVRPTFAFHRKVAEGHPESFEFGEGRHPLLARELRASAAYLVAAAIVNMGDAAFEPGSLTLPGLQDALGPIGLRCAPFGRALLISSREESEP